MNKVRCSIVKRAIMVAGFVMLAWPAMSFAQSRLVVVRPRRSRVVIYQPRSSVIYRRPYYSYRSYNSYPQSYYYDGYYGGYSQPYYSTNYYSYRYTQPYFANRYTYSWANPTYRYYGDGYYRRHRRNGLTIRLGLR